MILWFDLALLLASSLALGLRAEFFGVLVFVTGAMIMTQIARTRMLIGDHSHALPPRRRFKAAALTAICLFAAAPILSVVEEGSSVAGAFQQERYTPLAVLVVLLAIVALLSLIAEGRRR